MCRWGEKLKKWTMQAEYIAIRLVQMPCSGIWDQKNDWKNTKQRWKKYSIIIFTKTGDTSTTRNAGLSSVSATMDHATARMRVCVFSLHLLPREAKAVDLSKDRNKHTVAMVRQLIPAFDPLHQHHTVTLCSPGGLFLQKSHNGKGHYPFSHLDEVQNTNTQATKNTLCCDGPTEKNACLVPQFGCTEVVV